MIRVFVCAALLLAAASGCDDTPPPRIPDPPLEGMERRVADLLRETRERVVAEPDSAAAWGELGATYQAHRLLAEADACYLRAHRLDAEDFRWVYLRAIAREVAGADAVELRRLFESAARMRPDYPALHVRLGDAMSSRGDLAAARRAFETAIGLDGNLGLAHRGLGQVLLAEGEVDRAVVLLERSVAIDPLDGSAWAALARGRTRAGDPAGAQQAAAEARRLGDSAGAMADPVFEEEVVGRGVSGTRALARAVQKIRAGAFEAALEDLVIADETHPGDSNVQYWLGVAHRGQGLADRAIEHFERALELDPSLASAHFDLAMVFWDQRRARDARPHYEAAVALDPEQPGWWFALARCRFQLGDRGGAIEGLEQVLRLAPDYGPAQRLLRQLRGES